MVGDTVGISTNTYMQLMGAASEKRQKKVAAAEKKAARQAQQQEQAPAEVTGIYTPPSEEEAAENLSEKIAERESDHPLSDILADSRIPEDWRYEYVETDSSGNPCYLAPGTHASNYSMTLLDGDNGSESILYPHSPNIPDDLHLVFARAGVDYGNGVIGAFDVFTALVYGGDKHAALVGERIIPAPMKEIHAAWPPEVRAYKEAKARREFLIEHGHEEAAEPLPAAPVTAYAAGGAVTAPVAGNAALQPVQAASAVGLS